MTKPVRRPSTASYEVSLPLLRPHARSHSVQSPARHNCRSHLAVLQCVQQLRLSYLSLHSSVRPHASFNKLSTSFVPSKTAAAAGLFTQQIRTEIEMCAVVSTCRPTPLTHPNLNPNHITLTLTSFDLFTPGSMRFFVLPWTVPLSTLVLIAQAVFL